MIFWLYWFPVILGLLSFIFCRFCLSKYDWSEWSEKKYKPYKMVVWKFLLYLIWVFTPLINWACFAIIMIAFIEDGYSIKKSIIDFFKTNKYVNFLNKEI